MAVEKVTENVKEAESAVGEAEEDEFGGGCAGGYICIGGRRSEDADRECGLLKGGIRRLHRCVM